MWVKVIDSEGRVHSENWANVYTSMRSATGTLAPGFIGGCLYLFTM